MNGPNKSDIEKSERHFDWMEWGIVFAGVLVVGGLLLESWPELKMAFSKRRFPNLTVTGGVIVTLGVLMEVVLGIFITQRAKRAQTEANERVAKAEKAAAEARLETERLRARFAWRMLSLDTVQKLAAELKKKPGSIWIEYLNGDSESRKYAGQFVMAFRLAEWTVGLRGGSGNDLWFGIIIPRPEGSSAKATAFIDEAFTKAGISFNIAPLPQWASSVISMPPPPEPAARIFIGPLESDIQDVK